jgi:hypothetical protein
MTHQQQPNKGKTFHFSAEAYITDGYSINVTLQKVNGYYNICLTRLGEKNKICELQVFANPLTDILVKYLFMDFSTLAQVSGNSHEEHYKKLIIKILGDLHCRRTYKCNLNISVSLKTYDTGKQYYYINYENVGPIPANHPLEEEDRDGEIVYRNKLSDILTSYLQQPFEEIEKVSGDMTGENYRNIIVRILNRLWD